MRQPAEYADEIERDATLPAGSGERFSGYGVMGLQFRSGHVLAPARTLELGSTPVTNVLNRVASLLPDRAWHSPPILAATCGSRESSARLKGADLGEMGPAPEQAHLRDLPIPQRGVFVVGRAFFA